MTLLSHTLDWSLFGANPSGHHIVSLFLHIGSVIFLFLFLNRTTNNIWSAAFAAALFALHPQRVESVAWASERKDVLSMFFGMTAIYAYAFYAENSKLSRYLLCLILFALSLMSKPMLVTLPFVLMLLDYWPLARWQKALKEGKISDSVIKLIGEKIPFISLTVISSLVTIWAQNKSLLVAPFNELPFSARASNAIISYTAYLKKFFWPADLAVFYPYEPFFLLWPVLISLLALTGITIAVIYYIKKLPFIFTGWFWYMGTLVPVIGLVQVGGQAMADRYTYLPSIGIAIIIAWGIPSLFRREEFRKKVLFPIAIAILFILAFLTWKQCGCWRNSVTLFGHALNVTKHNIQAHNNFGMALFARGEISKALDHYNKALLIKPDILTYYNRANAYIKLGQYQKALEDYNEIVRMKPHYAAAYYNRGTLYAKALGQYKLAVDDFNKAILLEPEYVKAYNNRGIVFTKIGLHKNAIDDLSKAINLKPDYADAWNNRAFVYYNLGDTEAGFYNAKKACELGNCLTLQAAKSKGL